MLGRISTSQFFYTAQNNIANTQQKMFQLQNQIATGKKINVSSDDPVGFSQLQKLNGKLALNENYALNIGAALDQINSSLTKVDTLVSAISRAQELIVNAQNGVLTPDELKAIGAEIKGIKLSIEGVVNAKDGSGNALFAGSNTQNQAFIKGVGGYTYNGSSMNNLVQVSSSEVSQTTWSAQDLIGGIRAGNGNVQVSANLSNVGKGFVSNIKEVGVNSYDQQGYTINVINTAGRTQLFAQDSLGNSVGAAVDYDLAGTSILVGGVQIKINGDVKVGDSFSVDPASSDNLLNILEGLESNLNSANQFTPDKLAEGTRVLSSALNNILVQQSLIGVQGSRLEGLASRIQDEAIDLKINKSQLEDVDLASVITNLQLSQTNYEASLKTFSTVSSLSLFNFLK